MIVACAKISGWTPTMCRIGTVYTMDKYRGNGYCTHLVAALCKKLQKEGKIVWIMADKDNPASNKVYQRIGFEKVSDNRAYLMLE